MEPFRIHILGCGSALPTLKHSASAQLIEMRGKCFMMDCGEGAQMQFRRSHVHFAKVSAIFISHLHGDHCFGLLCLFFIFGMLGRTSRLKVFAPECYASLFEQQMNFFMQGMTYEIEFVPVDTTQQKVVYEDHSVTVETVPLRHRVPCCGYIFREKPTLPHIRRDMIDYYGIPLSQLNNIKNGADWTTPEGDIVPNSRLVEPADAPRSYAYCSDTAPFPELSTWVKGVDLLYHEATYTRDMEDKAAERFHSTAAQAALCAKEAGAGQLLLGHYSSKYRDLSVLLEEAKEIFPATCLGKDLDVIDIPLKKLL